MKDCEVGQPGEPSNISLITVDKASPRPFTLRFIPATKETTTRKDPES
jgi:hypothetical protein